MSLLSRSNLKRSVCFSLWHVGYFWHSKTFCVCFTPTPPGSKCLLPLSVFGFSKDTTSAPLSPCWVLQITDLIRWSEQGIPSSLGYLLTLIIAARVNPPELQLRQSQNTPVFQMELSGNSYVFASRCHFWPAFSWKAMSYCWKFWLPIKLSEKKIWYDKKFKEKRQIIRNIGNMTYRYYDNANNLVDDNIDLIKRMQVN